MTKVIVETTGEFMLMTVEGEVIEAWRPSVVTYSTFITQRHNLGQLNILAELSDDADDEKFVSVWEKNPKGAVAAFAKKHGGKKLKSGEAPEIDPVVDPTANIEPVTEPVIEKIEPAVETEEKAE